MDQTPISHHISFFEAVCHRPGMYTATGTLEEVFCFLNGFYSGMLAHRTNQRAFARAYQEWHEFLEFANTAISGDSIGDWRVLYSSLRQTHAEDAAAFTQLLTSYQDYRRKCQNTIKVQPPHS
jgi:hypothetical protein